MGIGNAITVELENKSTGARQKFRIDHAQALLKYERHDIKVECWIIPSDSEYTFKDGQLIKSGGPGKNQGAQKFKRDKQSETKENPPSTAHGVGDGNDALN